jgi:hypothetical protein
MTIKTKKDITNNTKLVKGLVKFAFAEALSEESDFMV